MLRRPASSLHLKTLAVSLVRRGGGCIAGTSDAVLSSTDVAGHPSEKIVKEMMMVPTGLERDELKAEGKKWLFVDSPINHLKKTVLPFINCKKYSTLESPVEGPIPPELLSAKSGLRPDRMLGQYEDLLARVTNFQNEDKGYMVLAGDVFDVPIRNDIIHKVVKWQLAKRRQGTHSTKTISEVSGTGKKPYKQKGTGRARHGTLRAAQFRKGETKHGPKPRSHEIKCQKKVRRLGLKIALSARTAEGKLVVFDNLDLADNKTKHLVNYITNMDGVHPLKRKDKKPKILIVGGGPINDNLRQACSNLHYINVLPAIGLNVYSILQHETLVMSRDAVDAIVERMHTPINR